MGKEDVGPLPEAVPKKRSAIQSIADLHLAQWLASDVLTPLERRKLTLERERRKKLKPPVRLALLVPQEGMTPVQFRRYIEILPTLGATEIHFPTLPSKVYHVTKSLSGVLRFNYGTAFGHDEACKRAIHESTTALAFPRSSTEGWDVVKHARHRSVPTRVVYPDGREVMQ